MRGSIEDVGGGEQQKIDEAKQGVSLYIYTYSIFQLKSTCIPTPQPSEVHVRK